MIEGAVIWAFGVSGMRNSEVVAGAGIAAAAVAAFVARSGETGRAVWRLPWLVSSAISRMLREPGYAWEMGSEESTGDKRLARIAVRESRTERVHRRRGSAGLIKTRDTRSAFDSLEAVRDARVHKREGRCACTGQGTDCAACGLDTAPTAAVARGPSAWIHQSWPFPWPKVEAWTWLPRRIRRTGPAGGGDSHVTVGATGG